MVWPPFTTSVHPRSVNSVFRPSPAATATNPVCGLDRLWRLGLLFGGPVFFFRLAVLLLHVVDLHGQKLPVREPCFQGVAGILGMHMDFDDFVIAHYKNAVAHRLEKRPQIRGILFAVGVAADNKFRAVSVMNVLIKLRSRIAEEIVRLYIRRRRLPFFRRFDHLSVAENAEDPLKNIEKALSARIDHACPLQNGEEVWRLSESLFGTFAYLCPDSDNIVGLFGLGPAFFACDAGNCQDSAFGWLHNRLVGGFHAQAKCVDHVFAAYRVRPLGSLRESAEQDGQDHAGVSARPAEHGVRGNPRRFPRGGTLVFLQFPDG